MVEQTPPTWPYIVIALVGLVNLLSGILLKNLNAKVSRVEKKMDLLVPEKTCKERRKVICSKISEHKEHTKSEFEIIWRAFENHDHIDGKVTR